MENNVLLVRGGPNFAAGDPSIFASNDLDLGRIRSFRKITSLRAKTTVKYFELR